MTTEMTASLQRQVDALRKPFTAFSHQFGALTESRSALAPKFMKTFGVYLTQTGGTFVSFVRLLDATVPAERDAYRGHKSYQAAEYLRRLVSRREPGARSTSRGSSALVNFARMVKTVLPIVRGEDTVWRALESECGFTARQITRLRSVVNATAPLLTLSGHPRPMLARVIHVKTVDEQAAA